MKPPKSRPSKPLVELNANLLRWDGRKPGDEHGPADALYFRCPHHEACSHVIPFTPDMGGNVIAKSPQRNGAHWQRKGDTVETMTLTPSVRSSCGFHGWVKNGAVEFCGDSK